jgi:hypothetical protein
MLKIYHGSSLQTLELGCVKIATKFTECTALPDIGPSFMEKEIVMSAHIAGSDVALQATCRGISKLNIH